jgi:ribonuclease P protein component
MLSKAKRLGNREVREVLKSGKLLRLKNLVVKYSSAPKGKAAVVVSKKVAHSAVERNRIRRGVYRVLSHTLPQQFHIVFLIQKNIPDYESDIQTACSKLSS